MHLREERRILLLVVLVILVDVVILLGIRGTLLLGCLLFASPLADGVTLWQVSDVDVDGNVAIGWRLIDHDEEHGICFLPGDKKAATVTTHHAGLAALPSLPICRSLELPAKVVESSSEKNSNEKDGECPRREEQESPHE